MVWSESQKNDLKRHASKKGILSRSEILNRLKQGSIKIDPFDAKYLNPASVDLTLGSSVGEYVINGIIDVRKSLDVKYKSIGPEGFVLHPSKTYLMHTHEFIGALDLVPVIDGKSSLGRLFISVHQTAGYIDPGFYGQVTLEVTTYHSVRVYAGMRFCQVRFNTIAGSVDLYKGSYQGSQAIGAIPSLFYKNVEDPNK